MVQKKMSTGAIRPVNCLSREYIVTFPLTLEEEQLVKQTISLMPGGDIVLTKNEDGTINPTDGSNGKIVLISDSMDRDIKFSSGQKRFM
jgi:hypothetical protein